tara:strand:+ start:8 stop:460 length:453 start_codon:yes stop_codon:yes gene_type:complete
MKYLFLAALVIVSSVCCSGTPVQDRARNSEIIVTYNGQEVHRAGSIYSSRGQLTRLLNHGSERKYIIFSAPWCQPCKSMIEALKQSGHVKMGKVLFLNLEEPWVAKLYQTMGLRMIPSMLVIGPTGQLEKLIPGAPRIVMHLIINVETSS